MAIIFLALGSNIENRKQHIESAISFLHEKIYDIAVAPWYETKPRYFEDQQHFLNTVVRGLTDLEPQSCSTLPKLCNRKWEE